MNTSSEVALFKKGVVDIDVHIIMMKSYLAEELFVHVLLCSWSVDASYVVDAAIWRSALADCLANASIWLNFLDAIYHESPHPFVMKQYVIDKKGMKYSIVE